MHSDPMEYRQALIRFRSQKSNAKRRGIGWELSFFQWCEFWGDDIFRRGAGRDSLCMARYGDEGPYAPDNIYKATNGQNSRTAGYVMAARRSKARKEQAYTEQSEAPCRERRALDVDLGLTENDVEMLKMFQPRRSIGY